MHFLPDVYVQCDVCKGRRFNRETLEVKYRDKSIADVLDMTVEEARRVLRRGAADPDKLVTLQQVGLGYIKIGQPATTLSGGEAQRVKLAKELSRARHRPHALHPRRADHRPALRGREQAARGAARAGRRGNTVVVIEHNLEVIKTADWIIDLGPDGGIGGGRIIAEGTPEQVAVTSGSYTGEYLRRILRSYGSKRALERTRSEPGGACRPRVIRPYAGQGEHMRAAAGPVARPVARAR